MAMETAPGMEGTCKVLKSDLRGNTGALRDTMLIMMQEKVGRLHFSELILLGQA